MNNINSRFCFKKPYDQLLQGSAVPQQLRSRKGSESSRLNGKSYYEEVKRNTFASIDSQTKIV